MSQTHHSHAHRKRIARIYVVLIFLLLAAAELLLLRFASESDGWWHNFIGILFGYGIAAILLLAGIWRRIGWSRYVLIGLNWLMLVTFTLTAAFLVSDPRFGWHRTLVQLAPPLAMFIAANTWLITSRRIRHLVTPPPSGG